MLESRILESRRDERVKIESEMVKSGILDS